MTNNNYVDWGLRAATAMTFVFLYAPLFIIVLLSFQTGDTSLGLSLDYYYQLLDATSLLEALYLSIRIAIVVMVISTTLGILAGLGIVRYAWPDNTKAVLALFSIPLTLPIIVYAFGLFVVTTYFAIPRGATAIVLGHIVYVLPFAALVMVSGLQDFDSELEEAAMDLGANELTTAREVTLPLLKPSILAAALFSFTLSFDEFLIAYFVGGKGDITLPMQIFTMVRRGISPTVYSISTLILVLSGGLAWVALQLERS